MTCVPPGLSSTVDRAGSSSPSASGRIRATPPALELLCSDALALRRRDPDEAIAPRAVIGDRQIDRRRALPRGGFPRPAVAHRNRISGRAGRASASASDPASKFRGWVNQPTLSALASRGRALAREAINLSILRPSMSTTLERPAVMLEALAGLRNMLEHRQGEAGDGREIALGRHAACRAGR